jgi:predicted RNase H-like HicB family nuclease
MKEFSVVIEKDEDGYFVASVPSLRGCHTQAKSIDTLMKRIREAIELCIEVEEPTTNEFIAFKRSQSGDGTFPSITGLLSFGFTQVRI